MAQHVAFDSALHAPPNAPGFEVWLTENDDRIRTRTIEREIEPEGRTDELRGGVGQHVVLASNSSHQVAVMLGADASRSTSTGAS